MESEDYHEPMPPLRFPPNCTFTRTFADLQRLHDTGLIGEVNFSHCMPVCGLCTSTLTEEHYVAFNLVLIGMILPLVGFLGLLGNGLSAFVYSRPEMRMSTNLYLCALGCSDSAVITTGIFLFFIDSIRKFSLTLTRMFGALSPIVYPMGMTAQTCSVYFTIVAGADCFAQVCLGERVKQFISRPSVITKAIVCVVVFSILYNIPHCLEAVVVDCWHESLVGTSLEVCPETLRFEPVYQLVYYKYMYSIFLAVGPLVILVILNVCIITASIFGSGGSSLGDTIALVLVVLLFIFCNVAALLLNIFEAKISEELGPKINYIVDLSNLLVVFNSSFNFVIYFIFSKSFRTTLKQYVAARKPLKPDFASNGRAVVVATDCKSSSDSRNRLLVSAQPEVLI